jgi:primary-amine oxidase
MALERLKQTASHVTGIGEPAHPFDPLSETDIAKAVAIIRKEHSGLHFNAVTLYEPPKTAMMAYLTDPKNAPRPHRVADVVAIGRGSKVYDGLVDLDTGKIIKWERTPGVQPLVGFQIQA